MRLLGYCPVPPSDVRASLGMPEYSYAFVAERFLPVLQRIGDVTWVADAAEAEAAFAQARQTGEPCVLLVFAPPNRAPVGLSGPTVAVFAWEFETIPTQTWDTEPRHDWRVALSDHGSAICLSGHTAEAVRAAMGQPYPITAIPAPIFDRYQVGPGRDAPPLAPRSVRCPGLLISTDQFDPETTTLLPGSPLAQHRDQVWDGSLIRLDLTDGGADRGCLVGFYRPEPWGAWSRTDSPWLLLPFALTGRVRLRLNLVGYGPNAGREIVVRVGEHRMPVTLRAEATTTTVSVDLGDRQVTTIEFERLLTSQLPESLDVRSMALGVIWVEIERLGGFRSILPRPVRRALAHPPQPAPAPPTGHAETPPDADLDLTGVVYTTVLNPDDGRKNWRDLVSAFCFAFRDEPGATLVLKMTHRSVTAYFARLQFLLHRIGPVACRVVAIHGFLSDDQMASLAAASTYYVNASEAEGLCMPLMEFLSAGVPAISPDHTAMADYLTDACGFVVTSSPFPTIWPQDPRQLWRAHKHRVHWDSLVTAYRDSFAVAMTDPQRYRELSAGAVAGQRQFCGDDVVTAALTTALSRARQPSSQAVR